MGYVISPTTWKRVKRLSYEKGLARWWKSGLSFNAMNCCNMLTQANWFKWLLNIYPSEPVRFYKYAMFPPIAAAVVAAPAVLAAAGFTAGGIAAGSIASSLMSAAALANGGGVVAGSVVAALQAAGVPISRNLCYCILWISSLLCAI